MGLTEPLALFGLLGVALPILAHLIRQKRLVVQPFPGVALLMRVMAARRRRVAMKDNLLLALRIAAIVALALALAGPRLRMNDARIQGARDLAIILDDSMSMGREGGAPLTRALAAARSRLGTLAEGSTATVVLAGTPARVLFDANTSASEAAAGLISAPRSTTRGTSLTAAFELARRELGRGRHADRQLLVLSDFNRESRADDVPWDNAHLPVEFTNVAPGAPPNNRRLTSVDVSPGATGEPLSLRVEAHGLTEDTPVSLDVDGRSVAHGVLTAGPGPRSAVLSFLPPAGDMVAARLHFETTDAVPEDDTWPLWLRRQGGAAILIVDGSPDPTGQRGEATFLARALTAGESLGAPHFRVVDEAALSTVSPGSYEAVFLAGALPSPGAVAALEHFVTAGGGLWVAPGPNLRARAFDRRLGSLLPAHLAPARPTPDDAHVQLGEGAAGLREADFAGVQLGPHLPLEELAPDARVWLSLSGEGPLLVEGRHGGGRVALLGTSVGDRLGDLPYQPGYLPLVLKLSERLARRGTNVTDAIVAGTPARLGADSSEDAREVELPSGGVEPLPRDGVFTHTASVGLYRVRSEGVELPRLSFAVVAPSEEGDLDPAPMPPALRRDPVAHDTGRAPAQPLAPWLYLLAGVLVLLEGILRASRSSGSLVRSAR